MDITALEIELKKRTHFPYLWKGKQSDENDRKTKFIYQISSFETLQNQVLPLDEDLKNYALNRWLNFWSAQGVEYLFASNEKVISNKNPYDKWVDFAINNTSFDHKTSVFPKGFQQPIEFALNNKKSLIEWFYQNQSQEGRKHLKNRLFIVLYNRQNPAEHWKLKAEILLIKNQIDNYLHSFSEKKLISLQVAENKMVSDIIWVIK